MITNTDIANAMQIHLGTLFDELPPMPEFVHGIRRAPAPRLPGPRRSRPAAPRAARPRTARLGTTQLVTRDRA